MKARIIAAIAVILCLALPFGAMAEEKSELVVAPESAGNEIELDLSLPEDAKIKVNAKVPGVQTPAWITKITVEPEALVVEPGKKATAKAIFNVGKVDIGTKGTISLKVDFSTDPPDELKAEKTFTVDLRVDEQPTLTVEFKPAEPGKKPRLELKLKANTPLLAETLILKVKGQILKLTTDSADGGKQLSAVHEFEKSLKPGQYQAEVEVRAKDGGKYNLSADFNYIAAVVLEDFVLDDKGGAPENGQANSGEKITIALKLKSLEPSVLKGVKILCPKDDPRLKPGDDAIWAVGDMAPGKSIQSAALAFEVGKLTGGPEVVVLNLRPTSEDQSYVTPMDLRVTVSPALELRVRLADKVDDPKDTKPNNGDGKANSGEKITLKLTVVNVGEAPSPEWKLTLDNSSPLVNLEQTDFEGSALAAGAEKQIDVKATVADQINKTATAVIMAKLEAKAGGGGIETKLLLPVEPPPLDLELVKTRLEDPGTGDLTGVNDNNGKLSNGEHGFLYLSVRNNSDEDLKQVFFALNSTGQPLPSISYKVEGVDIAGKATVERMFEIKMPIDYLDNSLPLTVRAVSDYRRWQHSFSLPILVREFFDAKFELATTDGKPAGPGDLHPGAKVAYKLTLTSKASKALTGLDVNVWSNEGQVHPIPNNFPGEDFQPGQTKTYQGTLSIDNDYTKDVVPINLSVFDRAYQRSLYKKTLTFNMGASATKMKLKAVQPDKTKPQWRIDIEVTDKNDSPVDMGMVVLNAANGKLSETKLTLSGGKGQVVWTPPDGFTGQDLIDAEYLGDESDPAKNDSKYLACKESIVVPPELARPTYIEVKVGAMKGTKANAEFPITVEVFDNTAAPVSAGSISLAADLGAVEPAEAALAGKPVTVKWKGEVARAKGTLLISYSGDETDPAKPDLMYEPCNKKVPLPPKDLKASNLQITPVLVDKAGVYRLELEVLDEFGRPISRSKAEMSATGGSFGASGAVTSVTVDMPGGTGMIGWRNTGTDQQIITATYPGDQSGPNGENTRYDASKAAVKLPPVMIKRSTVFVVDASGSMATNNKIGKAKAAVRAALSGYASDQGEEEWALVVFFGCSNIKLMQGFTTNPRDITSKLGFRPSGSTPVAKSMRFAASYLRRAARGQTGRIIMLTDGGETCSGNPVEAAKGIHQRTRNVNLGNP